MHHLLVLQKINLLQLKRFRSNHHHMHQTLLKQVLSHYQHSHKYMNQLELLSHHSQMLLGPYIQELDLLHMNSHNHNQSFLQLCIHNSIHSYNKSFPLLVHHLLLMDNPMHMNHHLLLHQHCSQLLLHPYNLEFHKFQLRLGHLLLLIIQMLNLQLLIRFHSSHRRMHLTQIQQHSLVRLHNRQMVRHLLQSYYHHSLRLTMILLIAMSHRQLILQQHHTMHYHHNHNHLLVLNLHTHHIHLKINMNRHLHLHLHYNYMHLHPYNLVLIQLNKNHHHYLHQD